MKKLRLLGKCLFVSLAMTAMSCSSDSNGGGSEPSGNYLSAKIGSANYATSSMIEPAATLAGNTLNIQSSTDTGDNIQIQIPNFHGADTYNNGGNNLALGYINYMDITSISPMVYTSYTSVRGTGQIVVTESTDTYVKGTFTATVYENVDGSTNTKEITNGKFRIEY